MSPRRAPACWGFAHPLFWLSHFERVLFLQPEILSMRLLRRRSLYTVYQREQRSVNKRGRRAACHVPAVIGSTRMHRHGQGLPQSPLEGRDPGFHLSRGAGHSGSPLLLEAWPGLRQPVVWHRCGFGSNASNPHPSQRLPESLNLPHTQSADPVSTSVCFSPWESPNSGLVTCRKFRLEGKPAICCDATSHSELHRTAPLWH